MSDILGYRLFKKTLGGLDQYMPLPTSVILGEFTVTSQEPRAIPSWYVASTTDQLKPDPPDQAGVDLATYTLYEKLLSAHCRRPRIKFVKP